MSKVSDENGGKPGAEAASAPVVSEADRRRARVAQKLRENLQRRKHQSRARRQGEADEADGLPAAKTTQPDD